MVQHADIDHSAVTGAGIPATIVDAKGDIIAATAADTVARLAVGTNGQVLTAASGESTGLQWATPSSGSTITGNVIVAASVGFAGLSTASNNAPAANGGYLLPIQIPGAMELQAAAFNMQAAASGTYQWGLFDYSSSSSACTKLAGGSGALNSTGWVEIAATSAPVSISAGNYAFIFLAPAANLGSMYRQLGTASRLMQSQGSYTWDDTPDLTTGWSNNSAQWSFYLRGDY